MRLLRSALAAAAFLCLANAAPVFAQNDNSQGNNNNQGNNGGGSIRGAPGPLAGAGLPFLIVAGAVGAYKLIRRREEGRQQRGADEQN
jgi:hypothetical protein